MGAAKLDIEFEDEEEIKARESKAKEREKIEEVDLDFVTDGHGERTGQALIRSGDPGPAPASPDGRPYRLGDELRRVGESNKVLIAEIEARIESEVQKAVNRNSIAWAQKSKMLEVRIGQLLLRIASKAPGAKADLVAIKKLLAAYSKVGA